MAYGNFWIEYDINCSATVQYCVGSNVNAWQSATQVAWTYKDEQRWKFNGLYKPYTGKVLIQSTDTTYIKIVAKSDSDKIPTISKLKVYIDVPDRTEHFENISIPINGLTLPIKTTYYYTTSVRLDSVSFVDNKPIFPMIVSRTPCIVKLVNANGEAVASTVDISWQGFQREII